MNKNKKTFRIVVTGFLIALEIILQVIGNFFKIGPVTINLSLIPIAIASIMYGPILGSIVGFVNGAIVLTDIAGMQPFYDTSVIGAILTVFVKSVLAGLFSGLIYKLFSKNGFSFKGALISSLSVPLINTGLFICFSLIFFRNLMFMNHEPNAWFIAIISFIGINFLIELPTTTIISPFVCKALTFAKREHLSSATVLYVAKTETLNNENIYLKYYNELPEFRKEYVDKYRFKDDKIRSVASFALLTKLLLRLGMEKEDIYFEMNQYGKPYISKHPNLHFNLSHSGNYVLVALSSSPIGCDIQVKENRPVLDLFDMVLSKEELNYIDKNKENDFYKIWCIKESYTKYSGQGLSNGLTNITYTKEGKIKYGNEIQDISVFNKTIDDNCFVSCCFEGKNKVKLKKIKL